MQLYAGTLAREMQCGAFVTRNKNQKLISKQIKAKNQRQILNTRTPRLPHSSQLCLQSAAGKLLYDHWRQRHAEQCDGNYNIK
jgi:hypothetical protein